MNVLIIHAHHEPRSFSSALKDQAVESLRRANHDVVVSDLYSMGFDPVSDRRNFSTVKDANYLKQQAEETHASESNGFAADVDAEISKLEAADAIIFSYPLWWFGVPAILKGWIDRVLVAGRVYGGPKLFEGGLGGGTKRGMVLMTTGGGPDVYGGWGVNPSLETILAPVQHGVFWFNGFRPLEPFVAWSPAHVSPEDRQAYLASLDVRLEHVFEEQPLVLPNAADFPNWGTDIQNRYIVVVTRKRETDEEYLHRLPDELRTIELWKRQGHVLDMQAAEVADPNWRAFLTMRAPGKHDVESLLKQLPLAGYLNFDITELDNIGMAQR